MRDHYQVRHKWMSTKIHYQSPGSQSGTDFIKARCRKTRRVGHREGCGM